jgi:hypothetical protein
VQVYDKDLRTEQLLGEVVTNTHGCYEVTYTADQFRRAEKRTGDLTFRVFSQEGIAVEVSDVIVGEASLPEPKVLFNAPAEVLATLVVAPPARLSQYEKLLLTLKPVLEDVQLADLSADDIDFLAGETGIERNFLEWLHGAAALSSGTGIPTEAFYAFARREPSLPADWVHLPARRSLPPEESGVVLKAILNKLTEAPRDELRSALTQAIEIDREIIPAAFKERIDDIVRALKRFGVPIQRTAAVLRDQDSGEALANYTIHLFDLDAGDPPDELGMESTNADGFFTLVYPSPETATTDARRRLRVRVFEDGTKEVAQRDLEVKPGQQETIEVKIQVPKVPEPPTHSLDKLAETVQLDLPPALKAFLDERQIRSLADIRNAGGVGRLDGLPIAADHAAVKALEAHADLSRLSPDVEFNASLIEKSYTSVAAIADAPRSEFVSAYHEKIGDFKAAQMQVEARARIAFLNNLVTEAATAKVNGFSTPTSLQEAAKDLPEPCSCKDCEAAVSPAAYLADLLKYTLTHVRNNGQKIDLQFLADTFHQPFGDLPADCEAVEQQVRQVRICIEVLRSYLGRRPLPDAAKESALAKAEKQYLVDAYTMLLTRIGTSYEEVRLARTAKVEERKALAERLGIDLTIRRPDPDTTPGDELDQLFLDPEAAPSTLQALTEVALERLFGLQDTTRDPLSRGHKSGDSTPPDVIRWQINGAIWGQNTDQDGTVYLKFKNFVTNVLVSEVEVFQDSARTKLVAAGVGKIASGDRLVKLVEKNSSKLSGIVKITGSTASNEDVEISPIPRFLSRRLKNLRKLWKQQDQPEDAYTAGQIFVELNVLPTGVTFPSLSSGKIEYLPFNRLLIFTGMMTPIDRITLLGLSKDDDFKAAVNRLYVESLRPPIIDPDVIGPDDFRNPVASSPDGTFDLWLERRKFVDEQLSAFADPNIATLFTAMYQPVDYRGTKLVPWSTTTPASAFDELLKDLTAGKSDSTAAIVEAAKLKVRSDLNLTPDMFVRLMELYAKAEGAKAKPPLNDPLSDDETQELLSILVQAQKTIFWSTWRGEERALETKNNHQPLFSREFFWPSIREPREGEWPPIGIKDVPFIDPDIVKPTDLPDSTVGVAAKQLWDDRRKELDEFPGKLKADREKNGFDSMLELALGHPSPGKPLQHKLDQLKTDLASTDRKVVDDAKKKITDDLHLTEESFRHLLAIRAKDAKPKPEDKPTAAEYAEVYAMLAKASKFKHKYRDWVSKEKTDRLDKNYWLALKARLPKWRANAETRQAWKQALAARTKEPIIDPDLIDYEDLRDPLTGKAFDMLKDRAKCLSDQRDSLNTTRGPANLKGFDAIVKAALGIDTQALVALAEENKQGHSIEARLEQLNLINASFTYLLRIRDLVANQQPIIDSEWEAVYSILVQAQKRRKYAEWRRDEQTAGIVLSPDHFAIPEPPAITFPPPEPRKLDPWRASWVTRRDWQDVLQSRIDQENAVIAGMHDVVSSAEEATLPKLRDTLVMAASPVGKNLNSMAKWVTDRFVIDAKVSGCQKTTRIAQAIETLQGLLFGLRTGQFNPDLELEEAVAAVSWDANRIDLFARSRSNILLHKSRGGSGTWSDWEPLSGEITSRPAATSRGTGRLDVFARLPDNTLGHREFNNGRWTDWESLGGVLTSAPAAVAGVNERLDVFVRGEGDTLQWWSRDATQAAKWEPVPSANARDFRSEPAVSSWGPGRLDVVIWGAGRAFPFSPIGWGLWHPSFENGNWSVAWHFLAGIESTPTAVSWATDRIDVSVRGSNNNLLHYWWDGNNWNGPDDLGGVLISAPALSSRGPNTLDAFVLGTDKQVWTRSFDNRWFDWKRASSLSLTLDAENFDDEWKWMGSYATWRAAMFVHMYPENVLHPTLRKKSTPVFQNLAKKLRTNRRLTPEQACALAQEYASYYEDVAKLALEATCQATVVIRSGSKCAPGLLSTKTLVFIFGRGGLSNRVYWSTFDPDDQTGYAQSFWEEIPGIVGVQQIVGAVPYEMSATSRRIFLFIRTLDKKLQFATFDLDTWSWSGLTDLALPPGDASWIEIVIAQRDDGQYPPQLAFRANGNVYIRRMNSIDTEWEGGEWAVNFLVDNTVADLAGTQQLLAAFDFSGFLVLRINGTIQHKISKTGVSTSGLLGVNYIGAVKWGLGKSSVDAWYVDSLADGTIHAYNMTNPYSLPIILNQFPVEGLKKIVPNCGVGKYVSFAYERQDTITFTPAEVEAAGLYLRYDELDQVTPDGRIKTARRRIAPRIVPIVKDQFSIPSKLDGPAIDARRRSSLLTLFQGSDSATNRTYVEEAYYFVPVLIADALQRSGEYIAALDWYRTVYNYSAQPGNQKIYYGLVQEESRGDGYDRANNWLLDPLNPHEIASTRRNTYTRYTILSIVRCLLAFADSEFTYDTPESVPRARILYETALELLACPELYQKLGSCDELIGTLGIDIPVGFGRRQELLKLITGKLNTIADRSALAALVPRIHKALNGNGDGPGTPLESRVARAQSLIEDAWTQLPAPPNVAGRIQRQIEVGSTVQSSLLAVPANARASGGIGQAAAAEFLQTVSTISGISPELLETDTVALPWLRQPSSSGLMRSDLAAETRLAEIRGPLHIPAPPFAPEVNFDFCIPPNPMLNSLRLHAELNLHKIRTCRNIAGMKRQLDPYAAPTDTVSGLPTIGAGGQLILPGTTVVRPTLYRYTTLIERAKQLVQLAAQVEAAMLSALEKRDAEAYTLLKARQDLSLAQASVQLQNLRIKEANDGVRLATLQQARAQIQEEHYRKLLEAGPLGSETQGIEALADAAQLQIAAALSSAFAAVLHVAAAKAATSPTGSLTSLASAASAVSSSLSSWAAERSTQAQIELTLASFERRRQDWELQEALAKQDVAIGVQQVTIANDHVDVVKQEKVIAEIQSTNAKDTIEFLHTKFTNVDLYDWMSNVLEGIYSSFLKQATSVAKLAENQLAFERQETPPAYIQADYWNVPTEGGITDAKAPDRRGLTGSARLLQDIYQLDQYAFDTNKRKLQLSKTLSLVRLAPAEFQRFRETGVLTFATPMEMFDRDFPGHCLRLIKRVRTSVIALVPPTQGIHATLSTSGLSRVVIGPEVFQTVPIRRDPELVALSSPINATGLFELEPQSDMLLPFEGTGVDTIWEFRMPKAANLLDYRTIADVLITIEYTALHNFDYYQQVIQTLRPTLSAERPFSFRNQFADQWYDLHNPEQTSTPMTVRFRTLREDFPPNLEALKLQHIVLYFARKDGLSFEIPMTHLRFTEQGSAGAVGGGAPSIDGVISTRRGNARSWSAMLGKSPFGEWELALPGIEEIRNRFKNEEIEDLLFVLTYTGRTPAWP